MNPDIWRSHDGHVTIRLDAGIMYVAVHDMEHVLTREENATLMDWILNLVERERGGHQAE